MSRRSRFVSTSTSGPSSTTIAGGRSRGILDRPGLGRNRGLHGCDLLRIRVDPLQARTFGDLGQLGHRQLERTHLGQARRAAGAGAAGTGAGLAHGAASGGLRTGPRQRRCASSAHEAGRIARSLRRRRVRLRGVDGLRARAPRASAPPIHRAAGDRRARGGRGHNGRVNGGRGGLRHPGRSRAASWWVWDSSTASALGACCAPMSATMPDRARRARQGVGFGVFAGTGLARARRRVARLDRGGLRRVHRVHAGLRRARRAVRARAAARPLAPSMPAGGRRPRLRALRGPCPCARAGPGVRHGLRRGLPRRRGFAALLADARRVRAARHAAGRRAAGAARRRVAVRLRAAVRRRGARPRRCAAAPSPPSAAARSRRGSPSRPRPSPRRPPRRSPRPSPAATAAAVATAFAAAFGSAFAPFFLRLLPRPGPAPRPARAPRRTAT